MASGDDVAWIGLVPAGERGWRLSPLGLDLYDGIPGVALFLAQLGVISGERRYSELAKTAVATMRRHLKELRSHEVIGGFTGWGGIIYALSSLGVIWSDTSLVDEAEAVLELLPDLIARDQALDVIGGSAGCALALRSLDVCRPSSRDHRPCTCLRRASSAELSPREQWSRLAVQQQYRYAAYGLRAR